MLCETFGLAHLSTGDMLRAERKAGTPLGKKAEEIINRGQLVSDDMVKQIVRAEAAKRIAEGRAILFDGYPRNLRQLDDLEEIMLELGSQIDAAIFLEVEPDKLVRRLSSRRTCSNPACGRVYNLISKPSAKDGICDTCGSPLFQRGDDQPEAIRQRLEVYGSQTKPMLDALDASGRLRAVKADRTIPEVREDLAAILNNGCGNAR